jgi:hypothetical protein
MYVFPFNTCEVPDNNSLVKQPASALINLISTIILFYLATKAQTIHVSFLLFCYGLFELWHTFSHVVHLKNKHMQTNVVHILGYLIAFSSLWCIQELSGKVNSRLFYKILAIIVLIDLYTWVEIKGVWTIFTGLSIFAFIIFGSIDKLSPQFKDILPYFILGLLLLFMLFVNENINCDKMLEYHIFPYHAIIEVLGLIMFVALSKQFLHLESYYERI